MRVLVASVVVGVLVSTACTATERDSPAQTAIPGDALTPTQTTVATPITAPTRAAAVPERTEGFFCETERGDVRGYVMSDGCPGNGFITTLSPDELDALRNDPFLPSCLQPAEGGMRVIVGRLCADHRGSVITDPRPEEFADVIGDADVIPWCRNSGPPDWTVTVGPPCIFEGQGGTIILSRAQSTELEWRADCEAGWWFGERFRAELEDLAAILEPYGNTSVTWEQTRRGVDEVLAGLHEIEPGDRARRRHADNLAPAYDDAVARIEELTAHPNVQLAASLAAEAKDLAARIEPPPHC